KSFFEALSFFLRYRLPLGYISAVGVGGARRSQAPKINSTSKKDLTMKISVSVSFHSIRNEKTQKIRAIRGQKR
ncbi:MAG: hypothetical protein LBF67_07930, partial [Prevotellaceae bacterium]|nr:hypothetical protein [Prevotellaceae bacterium]